MSWHLGSIVLVCGKAFSYTQKNVDPIECPDEACPRRDWHRRFKATLQGEPKGRYGPESTPAIPAVRQMRRSRIQPRTAAEL